MVATELLTLAMETDEERKARLKKMVATTQLRLAPETEDEREYFNLVPPPLYFVFDISNLLSYIQNNFKL